MPKSLAASAAIAAYAFLNVTVTKNWAFQPSNAFGDTYTHMSTVAVTGSRGVVTVACQAAKVHCSYVVNFHRH